jgi:hypothetical protein
MHISIPPDTELLAMSQAAAAGFTSIDEYVANLIRCQPNPVLPSTREKALQELRQLRKELPQLSATEIVHLVHDARADLS